MREIIRKESGVRFDPVLVDLFFNVLDAEGDALLDQLSAVGVRESA